MLGMLKHPSIPEYNAFAPRAFPFCRGGGA